ncbi:MAG: phenylacetate--CoA ligase [Desulfobacterota bacterium]|nr:phenylacetate--CoA ligase [Thermodesulfobacteriota bacterium]
MAIWEKKYECCPREELEQLQLERLQSSLNRAYKNVSFYRKMFDRLTIVPEDISTQADFSKLPFTTKKDLHENYPYGLFAVPLREVVRIHTTTETSLTPTVVGFTRNDLHNWANLVARFLTASGITDDDVIQISCHYGLYTGAFGLHHGAERIGASVIPASSGNTEKQIRIMQDYRTTVIATTPSYALILAEQIERLGFDPKQLLLKKGILGGEIWSETTRQYIEERLFIEVFDNYGVSELMGPGIAGECEARCGMHIGEDHFLPEIIDPSTGTVLPQGATGELVLSTLTREAFPLIRYRTGDITRLEYAPCSCGRTTVRMQRIEGRTDDIIIIKGISVLPSAIEHTLADIEGCQPHYQIIVQRINNRDVLEVHVAVSEHIFFDEIKRQEFFRDKVRETLSRRLGLRVDVKLMEQKTLTEQVRSQGRVVDRRLL